MKFLKWALFVLILSSPLIASAHWHGSYRNRHAPHTPAPQPAPAPVPQPTPPPPSQSTSQNCLNVGYSPDGQVDFTKLTNISCVRIAFKNPNNPVSESVALAAKANEKYVIIGNDGDLTSASYTSGVVVEAQWAQTHGIDEVTIGNEFQKTPSTQQELAALSCQVRGVYSGVVSYSTYLDPSYDDIKAWAANMGCLSKLDLNVYSAYQTTFAEAQQYLPGKWGISELGMDCGYFDCTNDATRANYMKTNILPYLAKYSVQAYWFSWDAGGNGVPTKWAMQNEPQTMAVI